VDPRIDNEKERACVLGVFPNRVGLQYPLVLAGLTAMKSEVWRGFA
jgi:hypothetical protein